MLKNLRDLKAYHLMGYRWRTAFVFAFVDPYTDEARLNKWRDLEPWKDEIGYGVEI